MKESVRRYCRGQALVEFALVLPVFLMFLFGAVEFGRGFLDKHLLTNAARKGARMGSLPGKTNQDVNDTVDAFLQSVGMGAGSWTTEIEVTDSEGEHRAGGLGSAIEGDRVYVTVSYDFKVLTGSLLSFLRETIQLQGRCVFRHE